MKISNIIPTYNRSNLLSRAIHSVLNQSYAASEIIVVDDGSTDDTEELISIQFPTITYLKQANRGVSAARNAGIKLAKYPWIAFLDADDLWLPQKLEYQKQQLEKTQGQICHTDEIWYRHGKRVNPMRKHQKRGGYIFKYCLPLCAISPSSVIIHRSIFDTVGTFDENLVVCEDYDLWLRITAHYPVTYVEKALTVKHGGHADQLSRQHWGMDRFRILALKKCLEQNQLSSENRQLALNTLREKINIYCTGAKKRGKDHEIQYYRAILQQFE